MGGGDFLRGNIYFFCTPIEEIYFFSHLVAGNIFFLSDIYRPIFQARNSFFLHYAWKDFFFPNFFLGINFFFGFAPPPPITFLMV